MAPLRDRRADRGHDPRRARRLPPVRLLAATRSATAAWTSPSTSPTSAARPGTSPAKDRRRLRWALYEAAQVARRPARPTATTTCRPPSGSAATAPAWRSPASCSNAATTPCASSATRRSCPHEPSSCAPRPHSHRCTAASSRQTAAATLRVDGLERPSGRNAFPQRESPHQHHVAGPGANPRSWTEVSLGARAQTPSLQRAHAPPDHPFLDIPTHDK